MAIARQFPHIWTTSLPRLLTGECSCEYAAWFKAHYQRHTRQPSDFDAVQWQIEHTALLTETRDRFLASGYDVFTEIQNAFRLQGKNAVLAGRPDLLIVNGDDVLIIDVKTGQERPSHIAPAHDLHVRPAQGATAVPRRQNPRRGLLPTHTRVVGRGSLDDGFIRRLVALIQRVAAPEPPPTTASASECRFCDITHDDCPDRIDADTEPATGDTNDF